MVYSHLDTRETPRHVFTKLDLRQSPHAEDCTGRRPHPWRPLGSLHSGPLPRAPATLWLPDIPSGLLYSQSFFILGWIMLLAEA